MLVNIEINGEKLQAENGTMLIELADNHGIQIPRFCYHKNLSIAANCRMCLVEVEGAPKPMPACATPITDGMKVFTRSTKALAAQKAVMEFLLINHPLDCPVCDQGGECDLQDFSVGYGQGHSQYSEIKRVVKDKDIGPLIATEMTRCIHCTRCVRFGQEIAGIREMGATGRGEHMEIGTYVEKSIDSELSGNIIDLCPVGALTSKPFRFIARSWEMQSADTVSAHDCVGSNLQVHTLRGQIKRVVARENTQINETWISDRDRFAYLGLQHKQRAATPMIKENGSWRECDWQTALHFAADGIKSVIHNSAADQLGVLLSPSSTVEECYLAQKLARGIGCQNIDHRLFQSDYLTQELEPDYLGMAMPVADLAKQEAFLLIGSNIRKEQPIIAHHIRQATLTPGASCHVTPVAAQVSSIHYLDPQPIFDLQQNLVVAPHDLGRELLALAKVVVKQKSPEIDADFADMLKDVDSNEAHEQIVADLLATDKSVVLLGSAAQATPDYSALRMLASFIAEHTGSELVHLTDGANSTGAYLAGAVPHRLPMNVEQRHTQGLATQQMFDENLKAFIIHGIEAEYDIENPDKAVNQLRQAFCVSITAYVNETTLDYADVILPAAVYTETSGTFVNVAAQWQSFSAVVPPFAESRPAWKIFRVLGNLFDVQGMDYISSQEVRDELAVAAAEAKTGLLQWQLPQKFVHLTNDAIYRIASRPLYAVDAIVRRADALQKTHDAKQMRLVRVSQRLADKLQLQAGDQVTLKQNDLSTQAQVCIDDTLVDNTVYLANSTEQSAALGCSFSKIELIQNKS